MKILAPTRVVPSVPPIPVSNQTLRWQCVFCKEPAVLMHKGSTYCRACYESHNNLGRLIG